MTEAMSRWLVMGLLTQIGRRATWILASGIFLGVAVPALAAMARPLLTASIFVLLVATVLRLDVTALARAARRPWLLLFAVAWVLVGAPLVSWPVLLAAGVDGFLGEHLLLTAASAPIVSTVAFALFLGLDAALVLAVACIATLLVPFTLPGVATALLGLTLPLDALALWFRLIALIGGAVLFAAVARARCGTAWLQRHAGALDGVAVTALVCFGLAAMDGVTATVQSDPALAFSFAVGTFALALGLMVVGTLVFLPHGRHVALSMGLVSAFNNFGLVVAGMGASASPSTVVYLGIAQFPIYVLPLLMKPLVPCLLGNARLR